MPAILKKQTKYIKGQKTELFSQSLSLLAFLIIYLSK